MLAVGDKLIVTQSYGMQGAEKSIDWAVALPEIAFVQWSWRIVPSKSTTTLRFSAIFFKNLVGEQMIGFCDFQILSLEDIEDFAGTDFPAAFVAGLFSPSLRIPDA